MSGTAAASSQGPGIVAPEVRDLDKLAGQLVQWLGSKMPEARDLRVDDLKYPLGAGMSHETILFDAHWTEGGTPKSQGMVVRIKPTRYLVYQDDMFNEQYQLMQLMHQKGLVRVPKPLWLEHDPTLLGAPFFVMEKVHGRVAVSSPPYSREGWLVETPAADRRRIWEDAVRQLAAIQKVPVTDASFLNLPGEFAENFDQEVDRWTRFLNEIDPEGKLTLLRDCYDQLLAARPANRPEGIVWGDSRLGNMMIGEDCKVVAVVDWEQPSLGGALHDLGWWLVTDHNQTVAQGIEPLEGMGTREETIALWSQECGKSAADIEWYELFARFKMECLAVRMSGWKRMPANMRQTEPGTRLKQFMAQ